MDSAAVASQEAHALAAVVRAASAQGDQAVALFLFIHFKGRIHVFILRIRHGLVENGVGHLRIVKNIRDLLQNTGFNDALVSDDQRFGTADAFQARGNFLGTALAHQGDVRDEEGGNLPHVHAFDIGAHLRLLNVARLSHTGKTCNNKKDIL